MNQRLYFLFLLILFGFSSFAFGSNVSVRWTGFDDSNSDFNHILSVIDSKTHVAFLPGHFQLIEDRELAHNHFYMYAQVENGIPIQNMSIRMWTNSSTGDLIQAEAFLESPQAVRSYASKLTSRGFNTERLREQFNSQETMDLVRSYVAQQGQDTQIQSIRWKDMWSKGDLVRLVEAKGQRGKHIIHISIYQQKVVDALYEEYPQGDRPQKGDEFSMRAQVFKIYEEVENTHEILQRTPAKLKYLKSNVSRASTDPYTSMRTQRYLSDKFDPVLGLTKEGRSLGYWSMGYIKEQAATIRSQLPVSENSSTQGGTILEGRYATINIHPAASKLQGLKFQPQVSSQFYPDWISSDIPGVDEMIPTGALRGKPIESPEELWNRPALRDPNHDPATYINGGFDEVQVYYAINTLMDSLHAKGFTDPDLSTRPFNAFLFNPDISMRDNAFYTDDTINFTTYSSSAPNMARDNPTIWHELGHGVMDRLMGDSIHLADTGGLSEGMADFLAALVIQDVSKGKAFPGSTDFRIINKTGFNLTNEVHDDGEAYGGALYDFLQLAMSEFGRSAGLLKVTDLTLEAMRLARNHPALTAQEWFDHMLFADELGNPGVRLPNELHSFILSALAGRNYEMNGKTIASLTLKNGNREVLSRGEGSRSRPVQVPLTPGGTAAYPMSVSVKNGDGFQFKFPVQVKVQFQGGPIQGAVHWMGEEKGPLTFTLNSPSDVARFDLSVTGTCDAKNREDGSCVDYAYIQIWNQGETEKPQAKKRFYVQVVPN
jgi:hypothetical protein